MKKDLKLKLKIIAMILVLILLLQPGVILNNQDYLKVYAQTDVKQLDIPNSAFSKYLTEQLNRLDTDRANRIYSYSNKLNYKYPIYEDDIVNLKKIKKIELAEFGAADSINLLQGIDYLPNIKVLDIRGDLYLSGKVDLSKFKDLEVINLSRFDDDKGNGIEDINLKGLTKLTNLNIRGNSLKTLDLSDSKELSILDAGNNKLDSINLSTKKLEKVMLDFNKLKTLDLSGNQNLAEINASHNELDNININGCLSLERVVLSYNNLKSLDLSFIKKFKPTGLKLDNNSLVKLDLNKDVKIENYTMSKGTLNSSTNGKLSKIENKFYFDLGSILDEFGISKVERVSQGQIKDKKVVFDSKIESFSYMYNTGAKKDGKPLYLTVTVKINSIDSSSEENIKVNIKFVETGKPGEISTQNNTNQELNSKLKFDIPKGYELDPNYVVPIVTKEFNNTTKVVNIVGKTYNDIPVKFLDNKTSKEFNGTVSATVGQKIVYDLPKGYELDDKYNNPVLMTPELIDGMTVNIKKASKVKVLDIPDENFRQLIWIGLQRFNDPYESNDLSTDSIPRYDSFNVYDKDLDLLNQVQALDCGDNGIKDLTGIEYFKNLKVLDVSNSENSEKPNVIKKLDLSKNIELRKLQAENIGLDSLILPKDSQLEHLYASYNNLQNIDLSDQKILTNLSLEHNKLNTVSLPKYDDNTQEKDRRLKFVSLNDNNLEIDNLDLRPYSLLNGIRLYNNTRISNIELPEVSYLNTLEINNINLDSISSITSKNIETLKANDNNLKNLDVKSKDKIRVFDIDNNNIYKMNLSDLAKDVINNDEMEEKVEFEGTKLSDNKYLVNLDKYFIKEELKNIYDMSGIEYSRDKNGFIVDINKASYKYDTGIKLGDFKVHLNVKVSITPLKDNKPNKDNNESNKVTKSKDNNYKLADKMYNSNDINDSHYVENSHKTNKKLPNTAVGGNGIELFTFLLVLILVIRKLEKTNKN